MTSPANAELVADLGAERVIDYTNDELASTTDRFEVGLDAVGNVVVRP